MATRGRHTASMTRRRESLNSSVSNMTSVPFRTRYWQEDCRRNWPFGLHPEIDQQSSPVRIQECIHGLGYFTIPGLVGCACQVFGGSIHKTHVEKQADVRHTDFDATHP